MAKKSREPDSRADELGFVAARTNPHTNKDVVLYSGEEAGFNIAEGKWTVFCTDHGAFASESNQRRARKLMKEPHQWCPECKKLQEKAPDLPTRLIPFDQKNPDQKEKTPLHGKYCQVEARESSPLRNRLWGFARTILGLITRHKYSYVR